MSPPTGNVKELLPSHIDIPLWQGPPIRAFGGRGMETPPLTKPPTLLTQGLPLIRARGGLTQSQRAAPSAQAGAYGRESWQLHFIVGGDIGPVNVFLSRCSDLLKVTLR